MTQPLGLIDAHCHLEHADFPDLAALIARAKGEGLVHAIVVGQLQPDGHFGNALDLARRHPDFLSATVGIHPHEAARATPEVMAALATLCAEPDVRAVGETGLDYYYDRSPRDVQREVFAQQCRLALRVRKPLVIHVRDAHQECRDILEAEKCTVGQIHCFTGDKEAARGYLELGFYLSISGVITYKKTEALQDAVRFCPLDRLLVETDSPFLAPIPHRGRKNEPSYVIETARRIAELKGISLAEVAGATSQNARVLFGLDQRLGGSTHTALGS